MRVEREEIEVIAILDDFRVEGKIHITPGGRISDFFNIPKKSLVITDAQIFLHRNNQLLYRTEFIILNRDLIKGILNKSAMRPLNP